MEVHLIMEIASIIIASLSVIVAVIIYLASTAKDKKVYTHNRINELFAENDDIEVKDLKKNYMGLVYFTRKVDRFAVEYNHGMLDKKIVEKRISAFLIRCNDKYFSEIIPQQRKQFKREEYFSDIDTMITDLRKKTQGGT